MSAGHVRVTQDWRASYADPIRVNRGDTVRLSGRKDDWHGHTWLWARARDGREGWLPEGLLAVAGRNARADAAFDAQELTCRAGDLLQVMDATHGWTLCRAADGSTGWVPDTQLAPVPATSAVT